MFKRSFACKTCHACASTELLCLEVTMVSCLVCDITEILDDTDESPTMEHFEFFATPPGVA